MTPQVSQAYISCSLQLAMATSDAASGEIADDNIMFVPEY